MDELIIYGPFLEEWKDCFHNKYFISNYGRLKNKWGNFVKPTISKETGYVRPSFWYNGKNKRQSIHRLVGIYFIDNPENLPQINHKYADKTCNAFYNLEWSTQLNNIQHAYENNLTNNVGEKSKWSILNEKQVIEIRSNGKYKSLSKIAIDYNVSIGCIQNILKKRSWKKIKI